MSITASGAQMWWMFTRAACLFSVLKALVASTSSIPSVSSSSSMVFMAWTPASQPASCPAHTDLTSSLMTCKMALPMMRLDTSLIQIGLTPGFLSNAISRHAVRLAMPKGSM